MSGNYFSLGNIDCLQNVDVPKQVGDIQVRMTRPNYHDTRFNGFGLQSPEVFHETYQDLVSHGSALASIRECIIDRVGVWQLNCPELRDITLNQEGFQRSAKKWHFDFRNATHRLLQVDASCNDCRGETNITTRRALLECKLTTVNQQHFIFQQIKNLLDQNLEYNDASLDYLDINEDIYDPVLFAMQKSNIIRQFFWPEDPNRPWQTDAYTSVLWDDTTMMHGTSFGSGKIIDSAFRKT